MGCRAGLTDARNVDQLTETGREGKVGRSSGISHLSAVPCELGIALSMSCALSHLILLTTLYSKVLVAPFFK